MYSEKNNLHPPPPDDKQDQLDSAETTHSNNEESIPFQETSFQHLPDFDAKSLDSSHFLKWSALLSSDPIPTSNHKKIHSDRLMQECFDLSSPTKLKPKRRKTEVIEVHGGRIVRSTGRKDRHSKVCTAKGPKDRRVRLSPKTAIQFYDVQDRLGYDRPSKAIDWLMKEAKSAIEALDEPQQPPFTATVLENHSPDHVLMNGNSPVTGLSFSANGLSPSSFQAFHHQDFNPSRNRGETHEDSMLQYQQGLQKLDTNSGMQGISGWNERSGDRREGGAEYVPELSSPPFNFAGSAVSGQNNLYLQREPLQSSIFNFSGISFSNDEFFNISALKEDGKDQNAIFRKPYSAAPFLNNEE